MDMMKEINNPNYQMVDSTESWGKHGIDVRFIMNVLNYSNDYIEVKTANHNYIIVKDWSKALAKAKTIVNKELEEQKPKPAQYKEAHKADFELLEAIERAKQNVNCTYGNLCSATRRIVAEKSALLDRIDMAQKEMGNK